MKGARYELLRVQRDGVPQVLQRDDDLEAMLRRRDELHESAVAKYQQRSVLYLVADGDDGERGYAEWCEECPIHDLHGAFGGECERCRQRGRAVGA